MSQRDLQEVWGIERCSYNTPWPLSQFSSEFENHISHAYTAKLEFNGEPVIAGYVIFWLVAGEAHFLNVTVHPMYRCQGIGSGLIRFALKLCEREKIKEAFLEVRKSNIAALRLYRKFGFKEDGVRKNYYADNGENAVLMALRMEG